MNPHGYYKIESIGNVVHVYLSGGFNEHGVKQVNEEIVSIAPRKIAWALFAHPQNHAGLTPEAVDELVEFFKSLKKLNCMAVGLDISSTWQGVLEKALKGKVDIPVYMSNKLVKVEEFVNQKLHCA